MKQMKFIVLVGVIISFSEGQLVSKGASGSRRAAESARSVTVSPQRKEGTVYTFSGTGSGSKILRLTGSHSSLKETSDSGGESALSQLLHASAASTSITKSRSSSTASASPTSDSLKEPASSTTTSTTSNAADHLCFPIVAEGIAAAAIAML